MNQPIDIGKRTFRIRGFISRKSDEWIICGDMEGFPLSQYYDMPTLKEIAVRRAAEMGITLPEFADMCNQQLREAEEKAREDAGIPSMKFAGKLTPEQVEYFKNLFGGWDGWTLKDDERAAPITPNSLPEPDIPADCGEA